MHTCTTKHVSQASFATCSCADGQDVACAKGSPGLTHRAHPLVGLKLARDLLVHLKLGKRAGPVGDLCTHEGGVGGVQLLVGPPGGRGICVNSVLAGDSNVVSGAYSSSLVHLGAGTYMCVNSVILCACSEPAVQLFVGPPGGGDGGGESKEAPVGHQGGMRVGQGSSRCWPTARTSQRLNTFGVTLSEAQCGCAQRHKSPCPDAGVHVSCRTVRKAVQKGNHRNGKQKATATLIMP